MLKKLSLKPILALLVTAAINPINAARLPKGLDGRTVVGLRMVLSQKKAPAAPKAPAQHGNLSEQVLLKLKEIVKFVRSAKAKQKSIEAEWKLHKVFYKKCDKAMHAIDQLAEFFNLTNPAVTRYIQVKNSAIETEIIKYENNLFDFKEIPSWNPEETLKITVNCAILAINELLEIPDLQLTRKQKKDIQRRQLHLSIQCPGVTFPLPE